MPTIRPSGIGERAIGKSVVRLLGIPAAFKDQQQRLFPGSLACLHHLLDARADVLPDLVPHLRRGLAQRPWVLLAQSGAAIGVVVEEGEIRAPCHPHGKARCEKNSNHGLEAVGPCGGRPQGSRGPVETFDKPGHLRLGSQFNAG